MPGHSASGQNNPERCPLPKYDPNKQQLEEAFETFNRVSAELDASYQVLQARIGSLTEELIEARSQRLKELAEKERLANRLALLMDELPGGVVVADSRGVIREANHAATQFLGCDLVSKNWQEVLSGIKVGERSSGSELVLNNGRHLSVNSQYMSDANEEVILLTDMTRLYELQEIASRDERLAALGEMAARLAHQIRTPLSSALLFSGHIVHTGTSAEQRNRVVDKVMISLRHMESLVDTMLSFVRGAPPVLNVITISKLAEELVGAIGPLVSSAGVTFRHNIKFDQPCLEANLPGSLLGNREALISAILNLVDNAIAMSSAKLILTLELIVNDNKLQISVTDNGPGITADIQDQVFDPFFTTREKGTGLGLAVVAMTARSHGGSASVASTLGQGSVFTLELPLHKGSAPAVTDISQHQYFPADTKQAAISGAI